MEAESHGPYIFSAVLKVSSSNDTDWSEVT